MSKTNAYFEPLVTVIIPAYNCENFIKATIQSVIDQTYENWRLIVIDDESKDSTCEIVNKLTEKDDRIQLIRNPVNMGVAKTRNRGLDFSQGDYVAFLDSDDVWHSDKLSKQIEKMQLTGADFSYTSYNIINIEGNCSKNAYIVPEEITFNKLLEENVIGCSTVVLSSEIAKKYRFVSDFYHEDYCLWLDILKDGYKPAGCAEPLVDWRFIRNSRSFDKRNSAKKRWKIYREYLGLSLINSSVQFLKYAINGIRKYYNR